MDDGATYDIAAQQEAAKDYQPVLEGPRVGDRTPSQAIAIEYAKADQIYVDKTAALPETYSHYRPIQGDGNCGWRAIGFSYFEKLLEDSDQWKIEGEVARLMSYNQMLLTVGGYDFYQDWADEMIGLLRELASNIGNPAAASNLLLQRWNDDSVEGYLIYYLRLLAATYLKAESSTYEPFVPDGQSIADYCNQSIELVNREIEHLGIVALVNVLLKPANMTLEIAHLDRTIGSQVNHHRSTDDSDEQKVSPEVSTIYLLYRPDHYDILYRTPASLSTQVQVHKVSSISHNVPIISTDPTLSDYSTMDIGSALGIIPGFGNITSIPSLPFPPSAASPVADETFSPHQSPWIPPFSEDVRAQATPTASQQASVPNSAQSSAPPGALGSPPLGHLPPSLVGGASGVELPKRGEGYPFRVSLVQLEYEETKKSFGGEPTFQVKTNTFKNSVWNRAHYGNPDFHPEEWSPEDESIDDRAAGKRRGKKGVTLLRADVSGKTPFY